MDKRPNMSRIDDIYIQAYYSNDAKITQKSSKAASVSRFSLAVLLGLSLAIGCHTLITIFF
ncbi:hypothetical protein EFN46_08670 [Leuconostoc pseudomesenteroides]|uniref:hypothetical protein n=1 Tax=Leuconostoc pseudomesenteroides TaxID=33968 RepID=UPI0021A9C6E9|nr:hypothetical protein [Leuconostoc pseudomesenteroides]MCT4388273.1 hypothetical protein [Leuconostoc pseudomesenteroides]